MNQDELKHTFRDATAHPPVGSRERVWRSLNAPARARRQAWLLPALAGAMVLVVGAFAFALRPRGSALEWRDERSVVLWRTAQASFDGARRHVLLERGEVGLSAWGGAPLELTAGPHTVRVEAGVTVVRVAGDSVTVEPIEGVVWFDGASMAAAPEPQPSPLGAAVLALEPAAARPLRLVAKAEQAVAQGRFEVAVQTLAEVASLGTLDAEVALYKKGELELRQLGRPETALATFEAGEARFARGALTQERQLSAIESCVKLARWPEVLGRTATFLERHVDSERADEVRLLRASALAATGDLTGACLEVARLPPDQGAALRAQCP